MEHEHLAGRPEQRELALADLAATGPIEELIDGVLRERLGVAGVAEPKRGGVAKLFAPVGVDDDDAVGDGVERAGEAQVRVGEIGLVDVGRLPR